MCSKGADLIPDGPFPTMLRRLYEWILALAARPSAPYALGAVSFAESSFFPIPPDVMLVPMAVTRPEKAWTYALIATLTSVAGGIAGYAIGALLYDSIGAWLFHLYGLDKGADAFREAYAHYGHWVILLKGLTPIPYKLVTITSGLCRLRPVLVHRPVADHPGPAVLHPGGARRPLRRRHPHRARPPPERRRGGVRGGLRARLRRLPLPVLRLLAMNHAPPLPPSPRGSPRRGRRPCWCWSAPPPPSAAR